MLLIEGTYRVLGAQPDGDSVRFYPNDPAEWTLVDPPHRVRRNAGGGAQLRLDGIDALETHYTASSLGVLHQPLGYAHQAAGELLSWLGFTGVRRDGTEKVTAATPDQTPGYVLTRGADMYGRCVALVGRGPAPAASGSRVPVDGKLLRRTANYRLTRRGLVYPTFYRKLYPDLRAELAAAVGKARPGTGLWPLDVTQSGADVEGVASLTGSLVILPKLFRRLADYLALNNGDPSLAGFHAYLAQRDDRLYILSTGHWSGLDYVVDVRGQTVHLTTAPEDLVFDER
jgi:hypothetical protein